MADERTELTPIIADCLIEMGCVPLIIDGIDPQSFLELIRETYLDKLI
jgi:hypothetical protein